MPSARDEVLDALEELVQALHDSLGLTARALSRAQRLHAEAGKGRPMAALLREEERPLIVELLSQTLLTLETHGSRFRRAGARVLHAEGLSMEEIAANFGVSRQRVSALIRTGGDADQPSPAGCPESPAQRR